MIKTLENVSIKDLLPESLKRDSDVAALAEALTPIFRMIYEQIGILTFHDGIPDHLLDFFAFEEDVDFYDVNMSADEKRALIEKAQFVHQQKGTVAAVEEVASIFFKNAKIREWFEYGGDPFFFKIETDEAFKNDVDIARMFRLIQVTKNLRSRLQGIWFKGNRDVYFLVTKKDQLHVAPVIRFFSGLSMPGATTTKAITLKTNSVYGVGKVGFSGELYSGNKLNNIDSGTIISGKTAVFSVFQSGEGEFGLIKTYSGEASAAVGQTASNVASKMTAGYSETSYCGKLYPGKGG